VATKASGQLLRREQMRQHGGPAHGPETGPDEGTGRGLAKALRRLGAGMIPVLAGPSMARSARTRACCWPMASIATDARSTCWKSLTPRAEAA
jgi:hypothetical protein